MAFSFNFVLAATIALALVLFGCNYCEADLINDVCSKATNPRLCNQALRSDTRSKGADLRGLAEIIIQKSQAAIRVAKRVAKSVQTSENKPIIDTCIETQNDANDTLNDCMKLLKQAIRKIDKDTLNIQASAAMTDVGTCDDGFQDFFYG
ncbi:pectinesterase inhibitor [Phtheirospermum japonicum]|uniref:Pectinesterase inhibitor n=1 Tax=Phtheirospermum japonicum TaxID=374723 RepID=A0A830CYC9_9LAMI|nr:pectinesterase inhibitor [Phtheirospermum japonicum]